MCDLTKIDLIHKPGESIDTHTHVQIPSALHRIEVRSSLCVLWIFMTSERRGSFGASVIDRRRTRAYWAWLRAGKPSRGWIFNGTCRNAAETIPEFPPTEPVQNSFRELIWASDLRLERERESAHVRNYGNNPYKGRMIFVMQKTWTESGNPVIKIEFAVDNTKFCNIWMNVSKVGLYIQLIKWRYGLVSVKIIP